MDGYGYSTQEVRVRAVQAVSRGLTIEQISNAFGISRRTLHRWLGRFSTEGSCARKAGSGRPRVLEQLTELEIRSIVLKPVTSFGF